MIKLSYKIKDFVILNSLKATLSGEEFLHFNDGVGSEKKMIGFSTQGNLEKLLDYNLWLADRTFKHKPEGFQQLWVIYSVFEGKTLPLVFVFMTNQTKDTYTNALIHVKAKLDGIYNSRMKAQKIEERQRSKYQRVSLALQSILPYNYKEEKRVLVDFEVAQASAFFAIFGITASGYFFHYWQCLERRLLTFEKDLLNFISSDSTGEARITFHYFSVLSLTPKLKSIKIYNKFRESFYFANSK